MDNKLPIIDIREKSAVFNAAKIDTGENSSKDKTGEKKGKETRKRNKSETTVVKFTEKEISQMAETFKKEFIINGLAAHVIKRQSGKRSICYEIRYRSNGYNISASSTDFSKAKNKFLEKTLPENIGNYCIKQNTLDCVPTIFSKFAMHYFENFRKRKVAQNTYKNDLNRLNNHILPAFGKMDIKKIAPSNCQELLDNLMEQNKFKTAVEVYNILSCIFKNAIAHDILSKSPLAIVQKPRYDQEHGVSLSKEDEKLLFTSLKTEELKTAIAILLYCGLRPNELYTAKIHGQFIQAVNSKRQKKDKNAIQYKYIPITDKLKPFLNNGIPAFPNANILRKEISNILPNHKLYDCRTTFYSRCKECKVDQRALDEFMGHSLGKIGNAYTDLPLEFLLKEGEKIKY